MSEEVEKINLDDYAATGEGATAISYTHKTRDTIAKLLLLIWGFRLQNQFA